MEQVAVVKKERILGLDIIRTLAIFFVFIIHSIGHTEVLENGSLADNWQVYMVIRFIALSAVPLFLILTGYLNTKKGITKQYYKGIIPILISYVAISLMEIIITGVYHGTAIDWKAAIIKILSFSANSYAWYFEMYIGLFLFIPFLNILYDNLKSKNQKLLLVGTLTFLTLLPQIGKSFVLFDYLWVDIIPDYWQVIYPITYFYIGRLIKEFQPQLPIFSRIGMFIASFTIPSIITLLFSTETYYANTMFNGFEALTTAFVAVSVFLLFYDIKEKGIVVNKIFMEISLCSFEMYLFSSIWDKFFYGRFTYNMAIMVCFTAISTYICSRIFILVRDWGLKLIFKPDKLLLKDSK